MGLRQIAGFRRAFRSTPRSLRSCVFARINWPPVDRRLKSHKMSRRTLQNRRKASGAAKIRENRTPWLTTTSQLARADVRDAGHTLFKSGPRALGNRERTALCARRNARRRRVPSTERFGPTGTGRGTQRCHPPHGRCERAQPRRRHPPVQRSARGGIGSSRSHAGLKTERP